MSVVDRAEDGRLHPHFLPSAAPMLFADTIKTVPDMREGLESLSIVGNVPRVVLYRLKLDRQTSF